MATTFLRALLQSDLAEADKKAVELAGKSILICHLAGKILAVSNICSHADEWAMAGLLVQSTVRGSIWSAARPRTRPPSTP